MNSYRFNDIENDIILEALRITKDKSNIPSSILEFSAKEVEMINMYEELSSNEDIARYGLTDYHIRTGDKLIKAYSKIIIRYAIDGCAGHLKFGDSKQLLHGVKLSKKGLEAGKKITLKR